MSAFIVSESTMNRVVSTIIRTAESFAGVVTSAEDAGLHIGRKLFALNARAVAERYREPASMAEAAAYRFRLQLNSKLDGYRALVCLLYQCCEGTVPRDSLYVELNSLRDSLGHQIITELPEYALIKGDSA